MSIFSKNIWSKTFFHWMGFWWFTEYKNIKTASDLSLCSVYDILQCFLSLQINFRAPFVSWYSLQQIESLHIFLCRWSVQELKSLMSRSHKLTTSVKRCLESNLMTPVRVRRHHLCVITCVLLARLNWPKLLKGLILYSFFIFCVSHMFGLPSCSLPLSL